ncbi:MAG TPA: PP2C family protein-serine/threonine phosphatase [Solirubrobacteraceae bacterium]|jgi:serine phosphatase RsbU (regulator of sigma subunit)|nr:PP2C family protein-serine/threonine phosphatase [Solirubrobacteraceae bacterium]
MPAPAGARHRTAPLASLALAALILIALLALAPGGAAAKRAAPTTTAETTPAPASGAPAPEAASSTHAAAKAERVARRRERNAAAAPEDSSAEAAAPSAASGTQHAHGRDPARKAQRVAERRAHKPSGSGTAAPAARSGASAQGLAAAGKTHKTHGELEREHERKAEQRRRERETAPGGRLKESRKQREAREAREGRELNAAAAGAENGRGAVAAGGVSNTAAGGAPTAQAPAAAVASSRTGHAARARRAARTRRAAANAPAGAAGGAATALGLEGVLVPTSAAAATAGGAGHGGHAKHGGSASHHESPLVRTVTQIVGVIPTALWLLIGALALAAAAFGVRSALAARRARRLERQRKELLADVGLLQAALLPELPARLGPVATSAAYRPASGPGAGGDFYDVFALPEGLLAVIVGDVSGHGREALPHTTLLRYTLRAYLEAGLSPREALRAAAPALERQLGGSFATVVLAVYDPRARVLTYSAAGHPHPILTGLDPDSAIIAASAPPIGAGAATGSRQTAVSVPGSTTALFYTDGVIEARTDGKLYGQRRLAQALASVREQAGVAGAPPSADQLLQRVAEQTDRRPDDMAATLLNVTGGAQAPQIIAEELVVDRREADGKRAHRFLRAAGLQDREIASVVEQARLLAGERGSALLKVDLGSGGTRVSVEHDNVAPLRARALARTQEVAL